MNKEKLELIIEVGLCIKTNKCAMCKSKMDIINNNNSIQLCRNCRIEAMATIWDRELENMLEKINKMTKKIDKRYKKNERL